MSTLDLNALKEQIEYYLSDKNLEKDLFFLNLISSSSDSFIDVDVLLNCNKIKSLTTEKSDLIDAIKLSSILELNSDNTKFKRTNLEREQVNEFLKRKRERSKEKPDNRKNQEKEKEEIVIYKVSTSKATEFNWKDIEKVIQEANENLKLNYVRFSNDSGHIAIFKSSIPLLKNTSLHKDDVAISVSSAEGDELIDFWTCHGNHINKCLYDSKSNRNNKNNNKNKNNDYDNNKKNKDKGEYMLKKPISLGNMKFIDVKDIRQKARSILNNIKPGDKPMPHDEKFLSDILKYHPNKEKATEFDHFTTGQNPNFNHSKCFLIVKKDGTSVDFSVNKCLDEIQSENNKI